MSEKQQNRIVYLSTFPPRECGIATFTKDLVDAMNRKFSPAIRSRVIAINNDPTDIYNYPNEVAEQITATNIKEYVAVAEKINGDPSVPLVHIQHEFGIFGGEYGNHLIPFFQMVRKPVVVTFHSVLADPKEDLRYIVQFIAKHTVAIVVMNEPSKLILENDYGVESSRVHVIPHGIPQVSFSDEDEDKERLGLGGKTVLTTFGHMSGGKGIEYAIRALPRVTKHFPNVLYLVIGATHPVVRKREGERYRNFLRREAERLKLGNHVKFYNKYLPLDEIISYLKATTIYLSPTLDPQQSVSGTLSYALGCGRPVISTKSLYAKYIIKEGKGILVPPRNANAIASALIKILKDSELRKNMAQSAYTETRHMIWPNVAVSHFNLYQKEIDLSREQKLPLVSLRHIKTLTDDFGIIQFAKHIKPDIRYGYSLDDNARALIAVSQYGKRSSHTSASRLLETYIRFMEFVQDPQGGFTNIVNGERKKDTEGISEDANGRTIWALGYTLGERTLPKDLRGRAELLLQSALLHIEHLGSSRAIAFSLIGLASLPQTETSSPYITSLANTLVRRFRRSSTKNWGWFEDSLTYSNSKLPEALLHTYRLTGNTKYLTIAEQSLQFLMGITFTKDYFSPIGQAGWYAKSGRRAYFDQQPEEVASMVQTLVTAYHLTKKKLYWRRAHQAFQWFMGKNHLNQMVYDETTGGCYDGVGRYSLNMNQGAESTISYLLARLAIEDLSKKDKRNGNRRKS